MIQLLRQFNTLFNRRERWQLAILSVALIIRAGTEMVGVASIMPFMSVVADPTIVQRNAYLALAYDAFDFTSVTAFVMALGVAVVVFLVLTNGFSALTVYGTTRFAWGMHHRLSLRLLKGYLRQPYGFFVQRNSAGFNKTLLNECQQVIRELLDPMLNILAKSLVVAGIAAMLVALNPVLALVVVLIVGGSYALLYAIVKAKQRRLGSVRVAANHQRFKITGEVFGGIKDVKVLQREEAFIEQFAPVSWQYSRAVASNGIISKLPRYLFETIAFSGIVLVILFFLQQGKRVEEILPVLSLYAFAGYRLMPELQQLFASAAQVRFNRAALDDLASDLDIISRKATTRPEVEPLAFTRAIEVQDVTFRYPEGVRSALDGISLRIERNQTIGLVGASGSGKTTLVDVLLGLYEPDCGRIQVDGVALNERTISAWRRQIGYVPQHIFLTDDSIAANIAFGVPVDEIDRAQVEHAARVAHLHEFIVTLPGGYDTVVGERGVRLSGGQRQRIGIARALYQDPQVLVMDEATSALDGATESAVMEAIHALAGKKTIILIAHRITTVRECDLIFVLRNGSVEQVGTYDFLMRENRSFREFAGVG